MRVPSWVDTGVGLPEMVISVRLFGMSEVSEIQPASSSAYKLHTGTS